jgi:hypothetical protein
MLRSIPRQPTVVNLITCITVLIKKKNNAKIYLVKIPPTYVSNRLCELYI